MRRTWPRRMWAITFSAMSCAALACADASPHEPTDAAAPSAAAVQNAHWAISQQCTSCLLSLCVEPDASSCPYVSCSADGQCSAAFSAFTTCYRRTRSLVACRSEVDAVKNTIPSGSDLLLDDFLLECFPGACEVDSTSQIEGGD